MIYPNTYQKLKVVLCAADTNILVTDKNINTLRGKISRAMMQLESWFSKKKVINTDKTKEILFELDKSWL
jgi:hypothetical protein